jgi:hypothetical protein
MKSGAQDQNIVVHLLGDVAAANIGEEGFAHTSFESAGYFREGASAAVAITLAAGTLGTYTSGGWKEIDATNMPGCYQFGIPNACLANGAKWVDINIQDDGATHPIQLHIDLVRSVAW